MGYYNTFVVKIWCEDCGQMIRGHIQHVSSQEKAYFLDIGYIADFVTRHLSPSSSTPGIRDAARNRMTTLSGESEDSDG